RAFLPEMVARKSGVLIQVASTASFQPVPYFAVYGGTKAFVLSFSEALRYELRGMGVRIMALCPGPTRSEFNQVAALPPRVSGRAPSYMTAEAVVEKTLSRIPGRGVAVVPGFMNRAGAIVAGMVPRRWMASVSGFFFRPQAKKALPGAES